MIQLFLCFDPSCNCPVGSIAAALVHNDVGYIAVSSGEDDASGNTVWLKGAISTVKHDSEEKLPYSYKSLQKRILVGADRKFEDGSMLGAFYQYADGDLKCGDGGRRNNINHGFSLRGTFNLTDEIGFVSAGSFTRSKVTGDGLPSGKTINATNIYNALNYGMKAGDYFHLKPKVGLQYIGVNRNKYTNAANMEVRNLMTSMWDAYTGFSLKSTTKIDDFAFRLKFFGDVYYNISSNKSNLYILVPDSGSIIEFKDKVELREKMRWSLGNSLSFWP